MARLSGLASTDSRVFPVKGNAKLGTIPGEEFHRKLSMEAFYHPLQRNFIDEDIWVMDETTTDILSMD